MSTSSRRLDLGTFRTGLRAAHAVSLALGLGLALLARQAGAADDPKALHRKGLAALAARDWKTAVDTLEAASAAAPNDVVVGTDYRQAVIGAATAAASLEPYVRCIAFFERLVTDHPRAANAHLNLGFAHVDKIPAEGAITQVLLANKALGHFGKALELEESWLGYYSRGHAYLFWPPIFGRVAAGIADLEKAVELSKQKGDRQAYYGRAWAALGDGYWRQEDLERARQIWKQGLALFPNDPELKARDARSDRTELDAFLNAHYDTTQRVATNLNEIYGDRLAGVSSK
ncbi:MAG: tetratricopeptide repeat protein [Vicinamibacteria bacterium]